MNKLEALKLAKFSKSEISKLDLKKIQGGSLKKLVKDKELTCTPEGNYIDEGDDRFPIE